MKFKFVLCSIFLCVFIGDADAAPSTYTGPITDVIIQPSPITSNGVRVSIQLQHPSDSTCTGLGGIWYSYDLQDGLLAKMWGAALLSSLNTSRTIVIGGTGNCDAYGIETVAYIDLRSHQAHS